MKIISEIIQDVKEDNKELWILCQDMAKAYDRINVHLLVKAMKRIKIPKRFIELTEVIFSPRTEVITGVGNTQQYEVNIGVIQGEVISPIIWCIYYDPLLDEINKQKLGYRIKLNNISQIDQPREYLYEEVTSIAFMDDTHWILPSKINLENILHIADSFYKFTGIKINKDKLELLVRPIKEDNHFSVDLDENIELSFGKSIIQQRPKQPKELTRILGCYYSIEMNTNQIKNMIVNEINNLIAKTRYKLLTDKN